MEDLSEVPQVQYLPRPAVMRFALLMEERLRAHDERKGAEGWRGGEEPDRMADSWSVLATIEGRALPQVRAALKALETSAGDALARRELAREAADVACMAMIASDVHLPRADWLAHELPEYARILARSFVASAASAPPPGFPRDWESAARYLLWAMGVREGEKRLDFDALYTERNRVAVLAATLAQAAGYHAYFAPDEVAGTKWPVLYIDLPTGQVSFRMSDRDLAWFTGGEREPHVPFVTDGGWDGHDNLTKWERIRDLCAPRRRDDDTSSEEPSA